jgi:hypothetical protein
MFSIVGVPSNEHNQPRMYTVGAFRCLGRGIGVEAAWTDTSRVLSI